MEHREEDVTSARKHPAAGSDAISKYLFTPIVGSLRGSKICHSKTIVQMVIVLLIVYIMAMAVILVPPTQGLRLDAQPLVDLESFLSDGSSPWSLCRYMAI